jgi:RecA-family ATPase
VALRENTAMETKFPLQLTRGREVIDTVGAEGEGEGMTPRMPRHRSGYGRGKADEIDVDFDELPSPPPNPRVLLFPKPDAATDEPADTQVKPRPYTVWSPAQFLAYKADLAALLLGDGYLERGEWTSLVGIGGLGKTRLLVWLCVALITGRKWCDLPTVGGPLKCLLLSTESGLRRWQSDLSKILPLLTPAEHELVEANLRLLALTPDEEGDLNLGDLENVARLGATLEAEHPGFIGLDPFADMVDGDENATVDVVRTLRTLRAVLRKHAPEAAVCILHHARTGALNVRQAGDNYNAGNFGRGAKALYSRVRCELQLAPGDRDNPNLIVLACGKANNCEKFKARGLVFDPDTFAYSIDPTFDVEAWRSDVAGKRGNKTVSIADVVQSVRELCPQVGDSVSTKVLVDHVKESTGAGVRTIKDRLREAAQDHYMRQPQHGFYALGSKPLRK